MAPRPRFAAQALGPVVRSFTTTRSPGAALPPLLSHATLDPSTSSVNGWVRSIRKQKNVSFAVISDSTTVGGTQVVLPKGLEQGLTVGCSASLLGDWVDSPKSGSGKEFKVSKVTWIGESDAETYPIPNTKQGIPLPLLRHNAHLRSRKQDMASVLNIRSEMHWAMTNHFRNEGFVKVEAPIVTSSDCEGGGEVFKVVDATSEELPPNPSASSAPSSVSETTSTPTPRAPLPSRYLSVSSQLHLEAIASSHPRVYAFSPCFRAEKSDTARHLQEFWMLEAELAFLSHDPAEALEQVMAVTEESVRAIATRVSEMPEFKHLATGKNGVDVGLADRTRTLLGERPYARMTYTDAIEHLARADASRSAAERFTFTPQWGASLQTEHEKYLAEELVKGPVFVTDYPTPLKPFYMLRNPDEHEHARRPATTACFDLLVPQLGELAGGSLRTHSSAELLAAIAENPLMKRDDYDWYLDLRKYGTTRHGGFGLGWERLVGLLTGMRNVRECIAFPRAGEGSRF